MRRSKSAPIGRGKPGRRAAARALDRQERRDWWAATLAAALIVPAVIWLRATILPDEPIAWTHQTVLLCLVVAGGAGRALIGFRGSPAEADASHARGPGFPLWPAILLAAIIPYVHGLGVGFLSDDFGLLASATGADGPGQAMRVPSGGAFYRPLSLLLWWVGVKLWGGVPLGYHVMNLLLHAANSLLVYAIGRRVIGSRYGGALAALLFAVHPLHVEPVIWASCLPDLLCSALSLSSLLLLEVYLEAAAPWSRRGALAGALAAFLLALLSKEASLALPVFVLLRLYLASVGGGGVLAVGGAYGVVLAGYLALRFSLLGHLGGYQVRLDVWNTVFPSAPLQQIGHFLMPIHRHLVLASPPSWLSLWVLVLLGSATLWWVRGLPYVPARRLWLWGGYVFIMSAPVWILSAGALWNLEGSRLHYLPTVGLAWLFGDLCAGRGIGWRRSGAVATATVIGAAALCVWYVAPWREAGRIGREVVAGGVRLVARLPEDAREPVLFVTGLPDNHLGAQVFRNCFPQALDQAVKRSLVVRVSSSEEISQWTFRPGEYLAAWRAEDSRFEVLRGGEGVTSEPPSEIGQ